MADIFVVHGEHPGEDAGYYLGAGATHEAALVVAMQSIADRVNGDWSDYRPDDVEEFKKRIESKDFEAALDWWNTEMSGFQITLNEMGLSKAKTLKGVAFSWPEKDKEDAALPKCLGTVGDINPFEYDGGYVLRQKEGVFLEYARGPADDDPDWQPEYDRPFAGMPYELFVVRLDTDLVAELSEETIKSTESICGMDAGSLVKDLRDKKMMVRAGAVESVACSWGWERWTEPETLAVEELAERWKEWCGEVATTERDQEEKEEE